MDGSPLSQCEVDDHTYFELGVLLAKMHTLADTWQAPTAFTRPQWDLIGDNPSWGRFWENPALGAQLKRKLESFRDVARDALAGLSAPDIGLIHADLVPDNVLRNDSELQLIDFDDGGYGHRLFDIATVSLKTHRLSQSEKLTNALVKGYRSRRTLDSDALPLFEAIRACSYIGWNIPRMQESGGIERNERFFSEANAAIDRYASSGGVF